jgi:hypothetical protein
MGLNALSYGQERIAGTCFHFELHFVLHTASLYVEQPAQELPLGNEIQDRCVYLSYPYLPTLTAAIYEAECNIAELCIVRA